MARMVYWGMVIAVAQPILGEIDFLGISGSPSPPTVQSPLIRAHSSEHLIDPTVVGEGPHGGSPSENLFPHLGWDRLANFDEAAKMGL